jgi:predicted Fe-Mo cluster-binding NifX family protein
MKIALVSDDEKTVSPHFGRAPLFVVVTAEGGKIKSRETRSKAGHHTFGGNHVHECNHGRGYGFDAGAGKRHRSMIDTIADCDVLIAGGMGNGAFAALEERDITPLITEVADIDEAVKLYLENKLVNRMELLH